MKRRNFSLGILPVGSHSEVTTTGSVQTLTRPTGADGIIMQNNGTANANYTIDESSPDADTGFTLIYNSNEVRLDVFELDIKLFLATGARVQYQWFRYLG